MGGGLTVGLRGSGLARARNPGPKPTYDGAAGLSHPYQPHQNRGLEAAVSMSESTDYEVDLVPHLIWTSPRRGMDLLSPGGSMCWGTLDA